MSALGFLADELRLLDERGQRRRLRPVDGPQGPVIALDGQPVVNFSSNNYLGLAAHPALREAAAAALAEEGFGAAASRLIAGNLAAHRQLEATLARFHGAEAALLFSSGYQANVGTLAALAGPEDLIISDALNHASIIDGCRLSRARVEIVPHRDLGAIESLLETMPGRRRFVVTDTLFSMDGDLAPLEELRVLATRFDAALVVDEAHATGTLGPRGRGLSAALGITPDVHIATLGKAFGSFGAYVAGSGPLVEFLLHRARSFVFTTALPPSTVAAANAAVQLAAGPEGERLRERLASHVQRFAAGLRALDLLAPAAGSSAIFPILIGDEARTMRACQHLLERGIYAQGIRPPTVPPGTSRLRFALCATHEPAQIDQALAALRLLRDNNLLAEAA